MLILYHDRLYIQHKFLAIAEILRLQFLKIILAGQ